MARDQAMMSFLRDAEDRPVGLQTSRTVEGMLAECGISLWPIQQEAIENTRDAYAAGHRTALVIMPTGTGKCLSRDSLVWSDGLRRFDEVFGAVDVLAGPSGPCRVLGWHDDGVRPGLKARLECGLEVDGSSVHRVWVRNHVGFEGWRTLAELSPGDFVAVARGEAHFGDWEIPLDEAYTLGLLVADGCVSSSGVLAIDKQEPVLRAVLPVLERWRSLAGNTSTLPITIHRKSDNHSFVHVSAIGWNKLLSERFGVERWETSDRRQVPPVILRGTRAVVAAFLRGYFDGDGYCDVTPGASTASPILAKQIYHLMTGLGVYCSTKIKPTACLPAHIITIRDVEAFAREVGFTPYGLSKDRSFSDVLDRPRNSNVDLVPGIGDLLRQAARVVPSKWRRRDAWRHVDAYYSGNKMPSYATLFELIPALPDGSPEKAELVRIALEHRAWSAVESVEPSTVARIDCEVEGHAFVGNGMVNHNTYVSGGVARMVANKWGAAGRTLFVTHTDDLIEQAVEKFQRFRLQVGLEKADSYARVLGDPDVVVASRQTLKGKRLQTFPRDYFRLVIFDEAHHSVAGKGVTSYEKIWDWFNVKTSRLMGLTAFAGRTDGQNLGKLFETVTFQMNVLEAMTAPHPGPYLKPITFIHRDTEINLGEINTASENLRDYPDEDLERYLAPYMEDLVNIAVEEVEDRRTIVFCPGVRCAQAAASAFQKLGLRAEWVAGDKDKCPQRKDVIKDFRDGTCQILCNVGIATEGFDVPETACVVMMRPTKSESLYIQMVGRVTRLTSAAADGKVVDFDWKCAGWRPTLPYVLIHGTHLARRIDNLNTIDEEEPNVKDDCEIEVPVDQQLNLLDIIEAVERPAHSPITVKVKKKKVDSKRTVIDPLAMYNVMGIKKPRIGPVQKVTPPSEAQKTWLRKMKIDEREIDQMCFKEAKAVLGYCFERRNAGMATFAQVKFLISLGVSPDEARGLDFQQAHARIDQEKSKRGEGAIRRFVRHAVNPEM